VAIEEERGLVAMKAAMLSKPEVSVSVAWASRVAGNDGITSRGCKNEDKIEQRKPALHERTFFCLGIQGMICVRIIWSFRLLCVPSVSRDQASARSGKW
jgi:hypothetical protein